MKTYRGFILPVRAEFYYNDSNMGTDVYQVIAEEDSGVQARMGTVEVILSGRNKGKWLARCYSLIATFPSCRTAAKACLREFAKQKENDFPDARWK